MVSRGIHKRRKALAQINASLQELNQTYPGERQKSYDQMNPEFRASRSKLLTQRDLLAQSQMTARKGIRTIF